MARSTYVYIVMWEAVPIGTFTVKHEMIRALNDTVGVPPPKAAKLRIYRLKDGRLLTDCDRVDITNQLG